MAKVTIYHNPKCSKSRETLALLREKQVDPAVVEYLRDTPTHETLVDVLNKLKMRPADVIRKKEQAFKDLGLADKLDDDHALIDAMIANPILIERPIVVCGGKARIGRPPEQVLEIL